MEQAYLLKNEQLILGLGTFLKHKEGYSTDELTVAFLEWSYLSKNR